MISCHAISNSKNTQAIVLPSKCIKHVFKSYFVLMKTCAIKFGPLSMLTSNTAINYGKQKLDYFVAIVEKRQNNCVYIDIFN